MYFPLLRYLFCWCCCHETNGQRKDLRVSQLFQIQDFSLITFMWIAQASKGPKAGVGVYCLSHRLTKGERPY